MSSRKYAIGCDVGATKISVSLSFQRGTIADRVISQSRTSYGPDGLIRQIGLAYEELERRHSLSKEDCIGIGVAFAGFVRSVDGHVFFSPNMPGWTGASLRSLLQDHFSVPTSVHNDANVGALGEFVHGGQIRDEDFLYVTVSTGIGGGMIINGRIYEGPSHVAGEIGHTTVLENGPRCGCGRYGCLEAVSSGSGIARIAAERMKSEKTALSKHVVEGKEADARVIFQEAKNGDALCAGIVDDACKFLGLALANAVTLMGFRKVVVGGGMAREGEFLRSRVERHMLRFLAGGPNEDVSLLISRYPDSIVDIGAVELAFMAAEGNG
ncbi:MAG: ROK family protein [Thermoprotei archaeon]